MKYDEQAEERLHKAVLCAEEVTRREEAQKWEQVFTAAREEWKQERQQLLHDAHQNQIGAVATENALLEEKLRKEFDETRTRLEESHEERLRMSLRRAWEEADKIRLHAVEEARKEELATARENAEEAARVVAIEKSQEKERAEQDKLKAVKEEKVRLDEIHNKAMFDMKQELQRRFEARFDESKSGYETKLNYLQAVIEEQSAMRTKLELELAATKELLDESLRKYEALKTEFSNFIDNVPGFRGEFILK